MSRKEKIHNKQKKNKEKNYRWLILLICISIPALLVLFVMDYCNYPSSHGLHTSAINLDFWSIVLGNGIVLFLFATTFILIDRRNIEKDELARYAGIVLLMSYYYDLISCLDIICIYIEKNEESGCDTHDDYSEILDRVLSQYYEKAFEMLKDGYISQKDFQIYTEIKTKFDTLSTLTLDLGRLEQDEQDSNKGLKRIEQKYYSQLNEQIPDEIERLREIKKSFE